MCYTKELARGGIDVSTKFTYYVEGKECVEAFASDRPISVCAYAYHGYPKNYVDFVPWYQTRTVYFSGWVMVVIIWLLCDVTVCLL